MPSVILRPGHYTPDHRIAGRRQDDRRYRAGILVQRPWLPGSEGGLVYLEGDWIQQTLRSR